MLASAIFLLVIMAVLGAFMVHVTTASQTAGALDLQGARAYQAARVGIERGLYAVQSANTCTAAPVVLTGIPGLDGFVVNWGCVQNAAFSDGGQAHTLFTITSTACWTTGTTCPAAAGEVPGRDYVERQLVVVTER